MSRLLHCQLGSEYCDRWAPWFINQVKTLQQRKANNSIRALNGAAQASHMQTQQMFRQGQTDIQAQLVLVNDKLNQMQQEYDVLQQKQEAILRAIKELKSSNLHQEAIVAQQTIAHQRPLGTPIPQIRRNFFTQTQMPIFMQQQNNPPQGIPGRQVVARPPPPRERPPVIHRVEFDEEDNMIQQQPTQQNPQRRQIVREPIQTTTTYVGMGARDNHIPVLHNQPVIPGFPTGMPSSIMENLRHWVVTYDLERYRQPQTRIHWGSNLKNYYNKRMHLFDATQKKQIHCCILKTGQLVGGEQHNY